MKLNKCQVDDSEVVVFLLFWHTHIYILDLKWKFKGKNLKNGKTQENIY